MERDEPISTARRLVITGGAGFIGSNLVVDAIRRGHAVLNIDRLTYASSIDALIGVQANPNYHFLQADIAEPANYRAQLQEFRPHAIIHLAAETHVDRSIASADPFVHSNVVGTQQLLECALIYWRSLRPENQAAFRLIHVSTDEVYGSAGPGERFDEQARYNPSSPYSATKAAADHLVRCWQHTYGLPTIVVHPSNNYGPNQHPEKLIPKAIQSCFQQTPIPIYGDGNQIRDWLFVRDHCEAIFQLLSIGRVANSYNIGSGNSCTNLALVQHVCDLFDEATCRTRSAPASRTLIQFVADRPGHDFQYAMDFTKLQTETDWLPQFSLEQGLRETIAWYLQHPSRLRS